MLKAIFSGRTVIGALVIAPLLGIAGCGDSSSSNTPPPAPAASPVAAASPKAPSGPMVAPSPTESPSSPDGMTDPSKPKFETKYYSGVGIITKLNPDLGSVELNHEAIKGLMPPMTMEYYLKSKEMLRGLAVGQKVDFTIEDYGGNEKISAIGTFHEKK